MYAIGIHHSGGHTIIRAAAIAQRVGTVCKIETPNYPEGFRHLVAIERLTARGASYANQDYDVLQAALGYLERYDAGYRAFLAEGGAL